jgi:hypothetical protein
MSFLEFYLIGLVLNIVTAGIVLAYFETKVGITEIVSELVISLIPFLNIYRGCTLAVGIVDNFVKLFDDEIKSFFKKVLKVFDKIKT